MLAEYKIIYISPEMLLMSVEMAVRKLISRKQSLGQSATVLSTEVQREWQVHRLVLVEVSNAL